MNKLFVAVVAAFAFAGVAVAADSITFNAKNGNVTFPHKAHSDKKIACTACHADAKGGKIEGFGKDKAHGLCVECHKKEAKGPQKCAECHKK